MTATSATAALELVELRKYYGKKTNMVRALDGISLRIDRGEFVSVVGRSGSGKTTLLDCIGLLMKPTTGSVVIDGAETGGLNDRRRTDLRGQRIGFIFQEFNLLPSLSAFDNVILPVRYTGGDVGAAKQRARALLTEVGLADRMHHRPTQMSGGEQQRVAIARSLVNEPAIVLGDEPTGEVDSETSQMLASLMRKMNRESGVTFVIVTHDLELAGTTDRVIRLKDGRVISDELMKDATHPMRRRSDQSTAT